MHKKLNLLLLAIILLIGANEIIAQPDNPRAHTITNAEAMTLLKESDSTVKELAKFVRANRGNLFDAVADRNFQTLFSRYKELHKYFERAIDYRSVSNEIRDAYDTIRRQFWVDVRDVFREEFKGKNWVIEMDKYYNAYDELSEKKLNLIKEFKGTNLSQLYTSSEFQKVQNSFRGIFPLREKFNAIYNLFYDDTQVLPVVADQRWRYIVGGTADLSAEIQQELEKLEARLVIAATIEGEPKHRFRCNYKGELTVNTRDGKRGFVDATGKVIIKHQFDRAWKFDESLGYARVSKKVNGLELFGFIDKCANGKVPLKYTAARDFKEGFAAVRSQNGKWGFVNTVGEELFTPRYSGVRDFKNGFAAVDIDATRSEFIDKTGKVVFSHPDLCMCASGGVDFTVMGEGSTPGLPSGLLALVNFCGDNSGSYMLDTDGNVWEVKLQERGNPNSARWVISSKIGNIRVR